LLANFAKIDYFLAVNKPAFCIFIDTVCEGQIPAWHDENLMPVVYPTIEAAQREIADDVMEKLQQFMDGQRMFCRTAPSLIRTETVLVKKKHCQHNAGFNPA
jgi:hypothetical protein